MRFLFEYEKSKKPGVADPTEASVMSAFRRLYNIPDDGQTFLVQEWSATYEDYMDVSDFTELLDLTKLLFLKKCKCLCHA